MKESLQRRGMLLGLIVFLHGLIFWRILSVPDYGSPPAAPAMVVATLLTNSEQRSVSRPVLPTVKRTPPQAVPVAQTAMTIPSEPAAPAQEAAQSAEPVQDAAAMAKSPVPPPVLPPRFDAAYLNNPVPIYPPIARRLGVQGQVLLRVFVSAEGVATDIQLLKSSGSSALDQAAMKAVKKWRFVPSRQGVEQMAAWVQVPIDFKLN